MHAQSVERARRDDGDHDGVTSKLSMKLSKNNRMPRQAATPPCTVLGVEC